jgi:hypothetical protein
MSQKMESIGVLQIVDVLPLIAEGASFIHEGNKINSCSLRLQTFKHKGTDCVVCGCKGSFFSVERQSWFNKKKNKPYTGPYHMNLYGIMPTGEIRMMTMDHIIPIKQNGADTIKNSIPMCTVCNGEKGCELPTPEFMALHGGESKKASNDQIKTNHS